MRLSVHCGVLFRVYCSKTLYDLHSQDTEDDQMFAEFFFAAEVVHPGRGERMHLAFVRHMSEFVAAARKLIDDVAMADSVLSCAGEVMDRPSRRKRARRAVNRGLASPVHLKLYEYGTIRDDRGRKVPDCSFVPINAIVSKAVLLPRYGDVSSDQFYANFLLSDCMLVEDVMKNR